ncbi:hypothetical protein sos41_07310 [Alphaproteobacteria bacterium SO-S41]|nr:hypothetical protein sos41_07310 [Alphaproteobacteria bacterium SO-S41]
MRRFGLITGIIAGVAAALTAGLIFTPATAETPPVPNYLSEISAIRNEGLQGSLVMDHLSWLADVYGPRPHGSPGLLAASDWAMKRVTEWGLANVHREYFKVGEGWRMEKSVIRMTEPQPMQIIGYPMGWTPGTDGLVTAEVVNAVLTTPADFDAWRGKLKGKIVLIQTARAIEPITLPLTHRYDDEQIAMMRDETPNAQQWLAGERPDGKTWAKGDALGFDGPTGSDADNRWIDELVAFLKAEGVVAVIERGSDQTTRSAVSRFEMMPMKTQRIDGGTMFTPSSRPGMDNEHRLLPWVVIAVEQYNRMVRILDKGVPVKIELDIGVTWYPEPEQGSGFNTLADLPGSDKADEIVLIGAHLDSAHAGSGATDNASGVAVVMEAMRILKRLDLKPRRTIRMALWGAEEVGLQGSRAYVVEHYGDPFGDQPLKPDAAKVSLYFNLDSGAGAVRGIFARNNLAAIPTLTQWIAPLHDLGVDVVAPRGTLSMSDGTFVTGGSDHLYFDMAGIPGLELIQDRLDYFSRTYHSNMDYLDRAPKADVVQQAVVLAVLAYQAAMADELLPRRAPVPRRAAP